MNSIRNRVYAGEIAGGADTFLSKNQAKTWDAKLAKMTNKMQQQMTKTGNSISSWFESARNAANTSINGVGK